jgi:putative Ca2+/H+ antiporter (TMEM165/GDT1 family)
MLAATLLSLGLVFLAELGDRSQLITMTYALRYRWWVVLTGVAIAACMVHGVTVSIGHFLGATLPSRPMAFASAIAFLIFAVWTWREGGAGDETVPTDQEPRIALLTVASSFALAEVSDKTSPATVTLASDHDWTGVWIGSTWFSACGCCSTALGGYRRHRGGGADRGNGGGGANSAAALERS